MTPDHVFLQIAYSRGGAVVVKNPEHRRSLSAAGLMEPAPGVVVYGERDHVMRLTKAGQARAKQIADTAYDSLPGRWRATVDRIERRHKALAKTPATRYYGTSNSRIKKT